jgi:hypothetical protein
VNHQVALSGSGIRPTTSWVKDHIRFFVRWPFLNINIPDRPWFDSEGTKVFETLLDRSQLYVEYGTGGSTVLAAQLGKKFVSVESDVGFAKNLRDRLGPSAGSGSVLAIDIGLTGAWGAPLFTKPTSGRLALWKSYAMAPWSLLGSEDMPDLVLIDGRFRVACALTSLLELARQPDATILVDDYIDRAHYHVIENFGRLRQVAGRMAVFSPLEAISPEIISAAFEQYICDWR